MNAQRQDTHEIQHRLQVRRADLLERETRVERDLERNNEPLATDADDQAIQVQNDEPLQAIGAATSAEIAAIEEALLRMELNLYGICKRCGKSIPDARLRAVPHATTCVECDGK